MSLCRELVVCVLQISSVLKCPVTKFITHTLSHFVFLFLLAVATFGLEEILYEQGK